MCFVFLCWQLCLCFGRYVVNPDTIFYNYIRWENEGTNKDIRYIRTFTPKYGSYNDSAEFCSTNQQNLMLQKTHACSFRGGGGGQRKQCVRCRVVSMFDTVSNADHQCMALHKKGFYHFCSLVSVFHFWNIYAQGPLHGAYRQYCHPYTENNINFTCYIYILYVLNVYFHCWHLARMLFIVTDMSLLTIPLVFQE